MSTVFQVRGNLAGTEGSEKRKASSAWYTLVNTIKFTSMLSTLLRNMNTLALFQRIKRVNLRMSNVL